MKNLVKTIKKARLNSGLSQNQLAKKVGVSGKTISAYEKGRTNPSLSILYRISKATNFPIESFFDAKAGSESVNSKIFHAPKLQKEKRELIDLFLVVGNLKKITRTGWVLKGIKNPESVAEHQFRVVLLILIISNYLEDIDKNKLLEMALIEDIGEALTGDIRWEEGSQEIKDEEEKVNQEEEAVKKVLENCPMKEYYVGLWKEFRRQETKEAQILKQVDKFEMAIQAFEYEKEGHPAEKLNEFWENAEKYLKGKELEPLFEVLKKLRQE
jgi:putative hydrolases of HD superfamily